MILEAIGFLISSVIVAVFCAYVLTGDLYPAGLKRCAYKVALRNWKKSLPARLGVSLYNVFRPKNVDETGMFPVEKEYQIEKPKELESSEDSDTLCIYGVNGDENTLVARISKVQGDVACGDTYVRLHGREYLISKIDTKSGNDWSCGTLKFEVVEPMRCWRVWYNGALTDVETGLYVHGVVNLLWKPLDAAKDTRKDVNVELISNQLACQGLFGASVVNQEIFPDGYSHFGAVHGTVKIDSGNESEVYLYGYRIRRFSKWDESGLEMFGMCTSNGNAFKLTADNGMWTAGEFQHVSSVCRNLKSVDVDPSKFTETEPMPKRMILQDAKGSHHVDLWPDTASVSVGTLKIWHLRLTLNSVPTVGIILRNVTDFDVDAVKKIQVEKAIEEFNLDWDSDQLAVLNFKDRRCQKVELTGGKGASLGSLAYLSTKIEKFSTATGFVVTTEFFRRTLDLDSYKVVFAEATDNKSMEDACKKYKIVFFGTWVQDLVKGSIAESIIKYVIKDWMNAAFENWSGGKRFAVRSSGTLEDGSDVSSAGQNQTFLGVVPNDIPKKIVDCWASLFTYQSVSYRLNHGQPAVSEMGVVIQEMVDADAAGVLFTANPITGNPFELLINANYGLGESVVSAACDPDTFILSRSRDGKDTITTAQVNVGNKTSKLVTTDDSGETTEVVLTVDESTRTCIDTEMALKLGILGVKLVKENSEKPLDIEWAVIEDKIFILQSRYITSLDSWSDFEIIHELDTPLRTNFERVTDGNTGEVLPGASSHLGLSSLLRALEAALHLRLAEHDGKEGAVPGVMRCQSIARQRLLLNVIQLFYRNLETEIDATSVAAELSICGHRIIDEDIHRLAVERWGYNNPVKKVTEMLYMVKMLWRQKGQVNYLKKKFSGVTFDFQDVKDDPLALYAKIREEFIRSTEMCEIHCEVTEASSATQIIAFLTLAAGRKVDDWDANLYTDLSKLLSVSQGVESADVPNSMNKFAETILTQNTLTVDTFSKSSLEEALKVVYENQILGEELKELLRKHGHRCMRELDIASTSWKNDPASLIALVQSIVRSKSKFGSTQVKAAEDTSAVNYESIINSLKTPTTNGVKRGIKFILPYCRSSVQNRETTKSLLVWHTCQIKDGVVQLSKLMKHQGLIPDENTINFLKFDEIHVLLKRGSASSRILNKALRRQKLYPQLQEEEFERVMVGVPRPKDKHEHIEIAESLSGTPVSSGKIQGTAKVCKNVQEASELLGPGDILITHGTDIAWSPFFPILGGVVTELGGLISHGAVVAREYGLPCVVGAGNATKIFKKFSGDVIILDANQGLISKVKA